MGPGERSPSDEDENEDVPSTADPETDDEHPRPESSTDTDDERSQPASSTTSDRSDSASEPGATRKSDGIATGERGMDADSGSDSRRNPKLPRETGETWDSQTAGTDGNAVSVEPGDRNSGSTTDASDDVGLFTQFRRANRGPLMWLREMLSSALIVLAIGLVLFAVSGVWPPMVAVESGSMEPNMVKGDLVFVTEPGRFAPDASTNDVGVVTYDQGAAVEYSSFGMYGSVVVFHEPGSHGPPIIHRAHYYVEEGENWVERADDSNLRSDSCDDVQYCPAPHDGFITKGDNNPQYDQASGIAPPVRQEWVTGVARLRIPYLGWVRLIFTGAAAIIPVAPETTLVAAWTSAAAVGMRTRFAN